MNSETAIAILGALFVAPFLWAALVALARRGDTPLSDAHEKAILLVMLAPILLGAAALALPGEAVSVAMPPLLDWVDLPTVSHAAAIGAEQAIVIDWALLFGVSLFVIYLLGAARFGVPLLVAHIRLHRWSAAASPHADISNLYISDAVTTPLAVACGRVLFPRALLAALSEEQVQLIVDHERRHHARGDVAFYAALAWIEVLTWFNPFVRAQVRRCRLAAELDCDAAVTATAPEMRKVYAETLLLVLKYSAVRAFACAPAVFSNKTGGEHRMRILRIMKNEAGASVRAPWFAYAIAVALLAPMGVAQLALAQAGNSGEFVLTAPTQINAARQEGRSPFEFDRSVFSHRPLNGRITGGFGARPDAVTGELAFHPGVDIAAPMGAPVVVPADGRVIRVSSNTDYGNMIEIDHGDGFALRYAHLSAFAVRDGDAVRAGQVIGRVGNSGRSTGTHLHIEVWRYDRAWDPRMVLDLPAE